jgi:hypothetical protein
MSGIETTPPAAGPEHLGGPELRRFFEGGLAALRGCARAVDRLNVFPVPDGDTGTNMVATLAGALGRAAKPPDGDIGDIGEVGEAAGMLAHGALLEARGNSGVILAQILAGLATALAGVARAGSADWAGAWREAAQAAWRSVGDPREGTVLTVVRETAGAAEEAARGGRPLLAVLRAMADAADAAVVRTTRLLPVLERAEVVDAGGLGLALVLRGGLAAFTGEPLPVPEGLPTPSARTGQVIAEASFPRFCTELVLTGARIARRELEAHLRQLGDSLDLTGDGTGDGKAGEAVHIHVHTDEPEALFAYAATLGTVSHRKVEDMEEQRARFLAGAGAGAGARAGAAAGRRVSRRRSSLMSVRIVTDSSGDLPLSLAAELGITVVPAIVRFGETPFLDGVEIDHDTFYRRLQEEQVFPTTSQPSPGQFAEAYDRLAPEAEGIVSIHLSSRLSGTFNSAVQGARACSAACPVEVVDSRSTSLGLGLIALEAARLARSGASFDDVLAAARGWAPRSRLAAGLDTLDFLAKGGRIGRARHLLGTLVRVRLVLALQDGEVQPVRQLRTRAQVTAYLDDFARRHGPLHALGIVYSTGLAAAEALADRLADLHPREAMVFGRVGPGLGSHTGPGMLGVALLTGQRTTDSGSSSTIR